MQKTVKYLLVCVLVNFALPVMASDPVNVANNLKIGEGLNVGGYLKDVVLGLFIILSLIIGFSIFLKKTNILKNNTSGVLHIVQSLSIGNREKLIVVNMQGKLVLLGVTASNIRTLTEMDVIDENSNKMLVEEDISQTKDFKNVIDGFKSKFLEGKG